jgi:ABC-type transport system involved in cytochrome bd biosynthesis fused ATPase/permease subunit
MQHPVGYGVADGKAELTNIASVLFQTVSGGLAVGLGTALAAAVVLITAAAIPSVQSGALAGVLLAALALLAMAAFEAVAPLGPAAASIDACAAAAPRIEAVLEREAPVVEPKAPRPPAPSAASSSTASGSATARRPWVLDAADLRLQPGRSLALLGPKRLGQEHARRAPRPLPRPPARPPHLGGTDLRELAGKEIRAAVRLSPQDAFLFPTTLRDNVAVGRPGAGDAEIVSALESVGLGGWAPLAYSYCRDCSTLRREARRAGRIAARTPARPATTSTTNSHSIG